MAEKSVEELVKEMSKLEEQVSQLQLVKEKLEMQLWDANKQAKAVDYIKQLADNYNVEYDDTEISGDYWKNLLTAVLFAINQQTEEDLEALCVEAEQILTKDANLLKMKDEEIASLQQQIKVLEKTVNQKDNDVNRLKKKEAQLSEVKQKLVDVKNSRSTINKNYRKLSQEKAKADKVLESLQVVIDETLTPEGVYANVVAMIIEKFQDAGYNVSPFNASESNSKENNREYELYKAVKKAKKSDKKAEKLAKDGEVSYSPSGYKTIEEDIINAYTQMKNAYAKAGVGVVAAFENKYSSDQDRQDGNVTAQEIIETIIDKEQSKGGFAGFIKTTQGKILTLAAVVVVATGVAFGGTQGYQAYQANQELYQTTVTLDQTQAELDSVEGERDSAISDKEQAETDKTQAEQERDEAKEQLNAKEEELQDYIEGFISGDIVTLDTTSQQFVQEFQTYETYLERITADDVRGIQSCQYNKETGDVSILLNCKTSDGSEVATHITFTMDMSNISQAISEGKSIL
ncbi:MAG: hypothetical protein IJZ62_03480, partial [Clostridia bacterium]|nr:hypothetical protein [Clostridia bacterium]